MPFSLNNFSFGLFPDSQKTAKYNNFVQVENLKKLNLNEIVQVDFPENQYYKFETTKNQIVLHHTVSGEGIEGDVKWWIETPEHVATSILVGRDGKIYQCFASKYWAHHLGIKSNILASQGFSDYGTRNELLNKASIGIEIDSWGGLVKETDGNWYPAIWDANLKKNVGNKRVKPITSVEEYPNGFMGFYGFEKYTQAQIEAVRELCIYWGEKFNIPLDYKGDDMWNISKRALGGESGVWTHVSYLGNMKSDCHPQQELINMLKFLK